MKHIVKSRGKVASQSSIVIIELLPDNVEDKNAIENVEACTASDKERELVNDYLLFNVGVAGQVIDMKQNGNLFALKVFHSKD